MLSTIFDSDNHINVLANRFLKKINGCIKMSFKRVRVSKTKKSEVEKLNDIVRDLKGKEDDVKR